MIQLKNNQLLFEKLYMQFKSLMTQNNLDEALEWAWITGAAGWLGHMGEFTYIPLEEDLVEIGRSLNSRINFSWHLPRNESDGARWLHVLTSAYLIGGHTRLAAKWMLNGRDGDRHSFVVTDQENQIPNWLIQAAEHSGGGYIQLPSHLTKTQKAIVLREISDTWADFIVMHTHPDDPIPTVAFGKSGGSPVICVNHAAQNFWLGSMVTDLVIDGREPEHHISLFRRHLREGVILPMPFSAKGKSSKVFCRYKIGVPEEAVMLLSIADAYKYTPYEEYNFPKAMSEVLHRHPNVVLVVIGPDENDPNWRSLVNQYRGRIHLKGKQLNLPEFYGAADIYLESFPIGSFTADLDAALYSLPVVLGLKPISPILSLTPYKGMKEHHDTMDDYHETLNQYITNPQLRVLAGQTQRRAVETVHVGQDWKNRLGIVLSKLGSSHNVGLTIRENKRDDEYKQFDESWAEIQLQQGYYKHLRYKIRLLQEKISR